MIPPTTTVLLCVVFTLLPQAVWAAVAGTQQTLITDSTSSSNSNPLKVPGASPAFYCSDPSDHIFQISRLDFSPTRPRIGYYLDITFVGVFKSSTGEVPWLNLTGSVNGQPDREPLYYSPLCDIDVFQEIWIPRPGHGQHESFPNGGAVGMHRACPPDIGQGYAVVSSPPIPMYPEAFPVGRYQLRAEAKTQDGRWIFCVEGSFDVSSWEELVKEA